MLKLFHMSQQFWLGFAPVLAIVVVASLGIAVIRFRNQQGDPNKSTKVSCRLKWLAQSQFAGNYVAVAQGLYKQAGLECTLRPGGQDFNAIKLVVSGSDDFGICGGDEIVIARSKGLPVVALAVIFQESPVCFFAKEDSGICHPKDFVGKRVAMQYGTNVRTEYVAMMSKMGIALDGITEVPSRFDMQSFFTGQVDVWNGYTINEVQTAKNKGYKVIVIRPFEYGIHMYADCIFTTEENILRRPEVVRAFVAATVRGWEYAVDHPEEAVDAMLSIEPRLNRDHELKMLRASIPLICPTSDQERGVGGMTRERWQEMETALFEQGVISRHTPPSECFTLGFLPAR